MASIFKYTLIAAWQNYSLMLSQPSERISAVSGVICLTGNSV